jgi:hypothetical protein
MKSIPVWDHSPLFEQVLETYPAGTYLILVSLLIWIPVFLTQTFTDQPFTDQPFIDSDLHDKINANPGFL